MRGIELLTASLVTFHNNFDDISKVIESFLLCTLDSILIVSDNSDTRILESMCVNERIIYIYNGKNLGFGGGHNVALGRANALGSTYHAFLNPDIYFSGGVFESLIKFMDENTSVGLLMPRIVFPDGSLQKLCKLFPSPWNLIFRRFIPLKSIKKAMDKNYELSMFSYDKTIEVPTISGCFMLGRTEILYSVNGFDLRYFMYMEDVDLCRKIWMKEKSVVFYPNVSVVHKYEKGSYKNNKLLKYHIQSAISYFNKWGWFTDPFKNELNKKVLKSLMEK